MRQTPALGYVNRKRLADRAQTTSLAERAELVYTNPVTAYSVGMHVQSDLHEAVLAPLRRPASSAVSLGELWLISLRRPRLP